MKDWRPWFDPGRSLPLYILGTASLTVGIQIIYDLAKEPFGIWGAIILAACLMAIVFLVITIQYRRQKRWESYDLVEESNVSPHKGLILLISPGQMEVPKIAIQYHQERLQHCWLICSRDSLVTADELEQKIHLSWEQVIVHSGQEYLVDPFKFESTWRIVERIYSEETLQHSLKETDVLADITGGPKPMTTGMALACNSTGRDMQYIQTPRDEIGNIIDGAPRVPILVSTRRIGSQRNQPSK